MKEHETRPTPETDYEERIDNGDTKPLFVFCRRLERERDEAREELARMQTMAASVADILAKRDAMMVAIWEAAADLQNSRFVTPALSAALEKLKPFIP